MQGLCYNASPTPAGSRFPALDIEAVACSGMKMLAGSPLSPRLGCGAGVARPMPGGGSRTWPNLAASGPSPVKSWPQGPQKCGVLMRQVLCTGMCWESFLRTKVLLRLAVP